jgi:methyl-accepting chemotaxis protein
MPPQQHARRRIGSTGGVAAIGYLLTVAAALALGTLSDAGWWRALSWALPVLALVVLMARTIGGRLERLEQASQRSRMELEARVEQLSQDLASAAAGDLHVTVPAGDEALGRLGTALNDTLGSLRGLVVQVRNGGDQLAVSAGQLLATAEDHAASATQQSSAVSETTSTIEELAATAAQIAETAQAVSRFAADTLRYAEDGRTAVTASVDAMDTIAVRVEAIAARALSLGEKSHEIGRILDVIDDLADQTNLLALNAAIEAARAGEHGRGFAVVASEVRALAQRSAGAAKEIKELIDQSIGKVDAGTKLTSSAGTIMAEVIASVAQVKQVMNDISNTASEQSLGIGQVNQAVASIDDITQQNAALVEQAAAAAGELVQQARCVSQAIAVFKVQGQAARLAA